MRSSDHAFHPSRFSQSNGQGNLAPELRTPPTTDAAPPDPATARTAHLAPTNPPIRFARCYRCGPSNLSILMWPKNRVKLFAGKSLHGRNKIFLSRYFGKKSSVWRVRHG